MKAVKGGYAYGSPPMGYRAESGSLIRDDGEQGALRRALELRRTGNSLRSVARTLTDEGHRPKRGGAWHPTTLSRALRREGER